MARAGEWLLIEWPAGKQVSTKYWLSTLPQDMTLARLVELAKLRWRIERDCQELKQEVGLGHFEGRGWTVRRDVRLYREDAAPEGPAGGTGFTTSASLTDDGVVIQILMENGLHGLQGGTGTGKDICHAALVAVVVDVPDHILVCRTVLPRYLVAAANLLRPERRPGPELAGDDV
jgi:hypothetical protein